MTSLAQCLDNTGVGCFVSLVTSGHTLGNSGTVYKHRKKSCNLLINWYQQLRIAGSICIYTVVYKQISRMEDSISNP